MNVLTINTGSSSLKMTWYSLNGTEKQVLAASVDRIGSTGNRIRIRDDNNTSLLDREERIPNHGAALGTLLDCIEQQTSFSNLDGIGHRVVVVDMLQHKLTEHFIYTRDYLVDLPEIANWHWTDDFSDPVAPQPIARPGVQTFTNA
jgi:acetate kinase